MVSMDSPGSFTDNSALLLGAWVQSPTLQLPSCVTLGSKLPSLLRPAPSGWSEVWGIYYSHYYSAQKLAL